MGRRMNINYSKLCLLILACTIAYNEYGAYWVCHARWPRLPSLDGDQVIISAANRLKTLLRHYAKWALTPQSLNVKLGPRDHDAIIIRDPISR